MCDNEDKVVRIEAVEIMRQMKTVESVQFPFRRTVGIAGTGTRGVLGDYA